MLKILCQSALIFCVGCSGYTNEASKLSASQKERLQPSFEKDLADRCGTIQLNGETFLAPNSSAMSAAAGGLIRLSMLPLSNEALAYMNSPGSDQPRLYAVYLTAVAESTGRDVNALFNEMVLSEARCSSAAFDIIRSGYDRIVRIDSEFLNTGLGTVSKERALKDLLDSLSTRARLTQLTADYFGEAKTFLPRTAPMRSTPAPQNPSLSPVASRLAPRRAPNVNSQPPRLAPSPELPETAVQVASLSNVNINKRTPQTLIQPNTDILVQLASEQARSADEALQAFNSLNSGSCRFGTNC
jgi:hypothetical protein